MPPVVIAATVGAAAAVGTAVYASNEQKKAQQRAQDFANQQAAESKAEQQRLEQKYDLTPGELQAEDELFNQYKSRAGKSGEQLLKEAGPSTEQLYNQVSARGGKTGRDLFLEEGGPAAKDYASRIEAPGAQDTFAPELELVRQMVNAEANRRGVFGGLPEGGIRFEQLGRAGVDLAIKSARESLAQKSNLINTYLGLQSGARAESGVIGERALSLEDKSRAELDAFLAGKNRTSENVALNAAQIGEAGKDRQFSLVSDIYGQQAGQAAANQKTGLETLGDIAGVGLQYGLGRKQDEAFLSDYDKILNKYGVPGTSIGLRTGAPETTEEVKRRGYRTPTYI